MIAHRLAVLSFGRLNLTLTGTTIGQGSLHLRPKVMSSKGKEKRALSLEFQSCFVMVEITALCTVLQVVKSPVLAFNEIATTVKRTMSALEFGCSSK